jgi:hypothetical protein
MKKNSDFYVKPLNKAFSGSYKNANNPKCRIFGDCDENLANHLDVICCPTF